MYSHHISFLLILDAANCPAQVPVSCNKAHGDGSNRGEDAIYICVHMHTTLCTLSSFKDKKNYYWEKSSFMGLLHLQTSYCMFQECKALTVPCLGHFSGLSLQGAALRDKVIFFFRIQRKLDYHRLWEGQFSFSFCGRYGYKSGFLWWRNCWVSALWWWI